ncbi:hypothetical protein APHAL10511_002532 [Amanita phalloides]|nr:hypothetical protein APHAL10511_002532 [Amanita phalloides]
MAAEGVREEVASEARKKGTMQSFQNVNELEKRAAVSRMRVTMVGRESSGSGVGGMVQMWVTTTGVIKARLEETRIQSVAWVLPAGMQAIGSEAQEGTNTCGSGALADIEVKHVATHASSRPGCRWDSVELDCTTGCKHEAVKLVQSDEVLFARKRQEMSHVDCPMPSSSRLNALAQ